ncbi:CopD family protein [Cellvibrio sp. KY-YJ-3]|uniref:CopD family protein n=1 Tax=Cellvibrio sp. KY-YJ-3 TaxID=454662 RepID=UPI001248FBEF|nr:CopD family protein [Cellvibrio sp. KY-YJ-3]QEY12103.1 CopD family protein [Cellvibrio sp. KY-YJ-3]
MLWIKALHIIAVITWMAALFYLPRLFVYHTMSEDEISRERFKIMERKLLRGIANPSMVAVFIFGIWMSWLGWSYYSTQGWYWCKLVLVAILTGYHHACVAYWKQLRDDRCTKSHVFFRWFNEFPVLLVIGIVILVVVKPF